MAKTTLVERDLEAGAALVRALDEDGWNPSAALWFYLSDEELWRLIVALPDDDPMPRQQDAYRRIARVIESSQLSDVLSIDDIGLARPDDQMLSLLRVAISTGPGISGIRFTHNTINNVLIEDAYIYRLESPPRNVTATA
jgi:hypothetical protein